MWVFCDRLKSGLLSKQHAWPTPLGYISLEVGYIISQKDGPNKHPT